ncbi:hypothetical protein C8J57DRAFT_1132587 [Mycena rebaudengoi]|nr:hypothetical protein C8J57DRAFT_1132587 [Mycena rebaudengoi]
MAAESLPDEILSEILSPALKVSEEMFSDTKGRSPFASLSVSSSAALLVCRAWLRVATPLLYHVVVLRSKAQARALQAALRGNPDLGKFIKMLRLEGGFGASIQHILQKTPNITDIFLSLQVRASDSTDGLALGLPSINPTRMIIYDHPIEPLRNKHVVGLIHAIEKCVLKWSNLNVISLPYMGILGGEREAFVRSLGACPTLESISFPAPGQMDVLLFLDLAENPSLESIELGKRRETLAKSIPLNSRLASLVCWTDTSQQTAVPKYKPTISSRTNPSFQPMVSCPERVREHMWSRILFFAMLPLETLEHNRDRHYRRLPYLLVSHLFHRLALPYLYRYVTFPRERSLHRFSHHVAAAPADGAHVREMVIDSYMYERHHGHLAVDLTRVFPYTPHLTRLLGDGETRMPWAAVTALADAAGGTLEELSGFQFHETAGLKSESPATFAKLTALRSLSWDGGYRPVLTASFFERKAPVPKDGLPALQFLHARSPEAFDVLAQMELPKLRRVQFEMKFKGWGIPLLQNHGHKLTELEVEDVNIDREHSVLKLCPNVTTLASRIAYDTKDNLGCPTEGFQHTALAMLILAKDVRSAKVKDEQEWATFFNRLEFACFPALCEVRIVSLTWPTTEYAISKSGWVKLAEGMLQRGVHLADKSGTRWRPRLKTSRR